MRSLQSFNRCTNPEPVRAANERTSLWERCVEDAAYEVGKAVEKIIVLKSNRQQPWYASAYMYMNECD